jgi:hypothetical protein
MLTLRLVGKIIEQPAEYDFSAGCSLSGFHALLKPGQGEQDGTNSHYENGGVSIGDHSGGNA